MDNQGKYKEDLLKSIIRPDSIERAPDEFTLKVMKRIRMEPLPVNFRNRVEHYNLIPVISVAVTLLFLIVAIFIPEGNNSLFVMPSIEILRNIKISYPEINLIPVLKLNLPATVLYIVAGIGMLALLDRALYGVFHRVKQE